ncbi:dephospho-CoA kinase [bacterium MnTg03]|nr:dephospho-CoA kinase [bacterium MnTg03]
MLTVGLTGGIGSGKSTVSDLFSNLGVPIIDTDLISHRLLEPDQSGYEKVVAHFGDKLLGKNQQIDRRQLRRVVFNDEAEKLWLEATLHPIIYRQTQQQMEQLKATDYVIVVIPLLFETDFRALLDRILVIDCCPETQIRRLTARDHIDLNLARLMLAQQWTNEARLERADDVIHNGSDLDIDLDQQVAKLHHKYLLLAA